jgi:predicted enzyme related to lactoylglutathione lyase
MSELVADYVRVQNRARAEAFYRQVFTRAAVMVRSSVTFFDVDGHVFGLLEPGDFSECRQVVAQSQPHLKLEVTDVRDEAVRLKRLSVLIVKPVHDAGYFRFVHFKDSEGNIVELYQTLLAID